MRAINSPIGPGRVSHYVKFWAVLGNEVKMMHFNHLNEPAKTSIRNSIQVHCNMQLVFGGHTFRNGEKYACTVQYFLQNRHKNANLYSWFPSYSPHSIKLSWSWSGLTTGAVQWGCREGGAWLSVLSRLVAVTQDTRDAVRSRLIELLAALQVDTRVPLSQSRFGHFQGPTIYFGSWQF